MRREGFLNRRKMLLELGAETENANIQYHQHDQHDAANVSGVEFVLHVSCA